MSFSSCGVAADVCARLAERGLTEPFPIQSATLPDALAGRDVCGRAPTGSGKTLAFGLAVAARVSKARPKHPQALILVPTRELAAQVQAELTLLLRRDQGAAISVYGGVGYGAQRKGLGRGASVVVACPGRLEDLIAQRAVFLDDVKTVVVDEADRMADMGFLPAVRRLLDATSPDRQTLLFSATLDREVDALVRRYQRDPVRHEVEGSDDELGDVEHLFLPTKRDERPARTAELVAEHGRSVVFCRTRRGADRLVKQLASVGVSAAALHGSRSQNQREQALASFSQGRIPAIVATDVMARGIHVDDVACVVHFDPPGDTKAYIHRSGRTGRAGASGVVVSLVEKSDEPAVRAIRRELGLTSTDRPRPTGPRDTRPQPHAGAGGAAGTVKFFRADKGFGFITREQGEDVFVHLSNIRTRGSRPLREGQRVEFELGRGRKGVEARNVRVVA